MVRRCLPLMIAMRAFSNGEAALVAMLTSQMPNPTVRPADTVDVQVTFGLAEDSDPLTRDENAEWRWCTNPG